MIKSKTMNPPIEAPIIAPSGVFESEEDEGVPLGSFGFGEELFEEQDSDGKETYLSGVSGSMAASVRPN